MKPYDQLTKQGKLRRLKKLAELGLTYYNIHAPHIKFYQFATNLLYQVSTSTGDKYMLRLAYPGWRRIEDLHSEALWINALSQDTDIPVPDIIPTGSGEYVLSIPDHGIPDTWHMTLMRWIPGRLLGHYLTTDNLEKMGTLFAQLHIHGAKWEPPESFTKHRFDRWLSRGEENLIINHDQVELSGSQTNQQILLSGKYREMLERMDNHVNSAYQAIDPSDLRVIHCDLWHDNIKIYLGQLYPFDFEDTIWGYRAHDIAMAMLDLVETTGEKRYPELLSAFRKGYEEHLTWPNDPIEAFQIGRILWKINWIARFNSENLIPAMESYLHVFKHYEQTGKVKLPSEKA